MSEKTIILKKDHHWFVINSSSGDEREILLTILEYAENQRYNICKDEVLTLIEKLGYQLDVHQNFNLAS
jgi:transcription antitermination factor NusG